MFISGIQKLSLLDYPEKVGCTLFTSGCNFRCPFCHNSSLVLNTAEHIPTDEIFAFLYKRKGMLDAVTVSGGEPLMQNGIEDFIKDIKALGYMVKLDTNGTNPTKLEKLIDDGVLDYVAMDLKNRPEKYSLTAGVDVNLEDIAKSVAVLKSGKVESEFRTTVVKEFHAVGDIAALTAFYRPHKYFLQCFKDSGELLCDGLSACSEEEMLSFEQEAKPFCGTVSLRGI